MKVALCTPDLRTFGGISSLVRTWLESAEIHGVDLRMFRVSTGGNKLRNLEFRLARTMAENPDVVIVGLDLQSNSARQTVGACNKLGLEESGVGGQFEGSFGTL